MATTGKIEQRLTALEREVAELKRQVRQPEQRDHRWPASLAGRLEQFPEWEEITRMGKQIGNAQPDYMD